MVKEYDLEERTLNFSINVLKYCAQLKQTLLLRPIIDQLIRSASSIGANYAEANNAESKADFKNKIYISKKEAAETEYWLKILIKVDKDNEEVQELLSEAHQLLLILQKIISKTN